MSTTPNIEPTRFSAGLTICWTRTFSGYDYADGYTKAYYTINGNLGSKLITGVYADSVWTFTLKAADNNLLAGKYTLFGWVEKGSGNDVEKYPVRRSSLEITSSLTTATTSEQRSNLELQLDRIQTAINNYLIDPVVAITISTGSGGSRTYQRPDLRQLYSFRALTLKDLRTERKKQNIRNGKSTGGSITTRFVNA